MVKEKKGWDEGFRENADLSPASQAPEFSTKGSPRSASLRVGLLFCPAASQPRRPIRTHFGFAASAPYSQLISASQPRRPIRN